MWIHGVSSLVELRVSRRPSGAHHVPDPQDDGSGADMAAQAAARGEPAFPWRRQHLLCEHLDSVCVGVCVRRASTRTEK